MRAMSRKKKYHSKFYMKSVLKKDLANPKCKFKTILRKVRQHVHELNRKRKKSGEFSTLYKDLREHPKRFKEYLRMKISTFDYVLSRVKKDLTKGWCNLHKQPILPEEQLVVTLRFLITGQSYRNLSKPFRMGVSTICYLIEKTLKAIWKNLWKTHMPAPTKKMLKKNAQIFYQRWNFPHCMGAIDVKQIRIKKPAGTGNLYRNYKNFHSIALQAVVDADYRYICIDVGGYGRQHDATTLRASKFYKALRKKIIRLPEPDRLPKTKTKVAYFFVGDGAYPLMENLLKPYPGEYLPRGKYKLNSRLSRARLVSECAFGQTCQKFQIFYTLIQLKPDKVILIGKAACILHNTIIDKEGKGKLYKRKNNSSKKTTKRNYNDDSEDGFPVGNGYEVREKMKKYVLDHPYKKPRRN